MGDKKLSVHIVKKDEGVFELEGISEDKILWYKFPSEFVNVNTHKVLITKSTIKSAMTAIRPVNGYRKLMIKIDDELKKEYFDDEGNLCFNKLPLEEIHSTCDIISSLTTRTEEENYLIRRIQELESKLTLNDEVKLHQVEKKFVLEKFDKKQNATQWLEQFEAECTRHKVKDHIKLIEILRFFLVGTPKDWYETNLKKIGLTDWKEWKKSFLTVFVEKGWSKIRKAYNFKYLGGSLMDYAITKEKLCMEAEEGSTVLSRINMVVVGLPLEIQDKLDREEITEMNKLFTELRKLDDTYCTRKKENSTNSQLTIKKKIDRSSNQFFEQKRKPCYICENLGYKNRFHPVSECRNKDHPATKVKVNLHETSNHYGDGAAEMMNIVIDDKSLN